jgi:ABC-2 type transport system ATP-binding protein
MTETKNNSLVLFENVSKNYGKNRALAELTFSIESGSVTALAGPNGAGKSTSLKLICGLLRYRGSALFHGRQIRSITDLEIVRAAYFLPEDKELRPQSRVKEVLVEARELGGKRVDRKRLESLCEELSVNASLERRVRELTPGMRTALYLAVTLSTDAELYALDEPLSGLDPILRTRVIGHMKELAIRDGKTVIYSTHILEEAEEAADRIVFMDRGRALFSGGVDEAKERYREIIADGKEAETLRPGANGILHVRRETNGVVRALAETSGISLGHPGKSCPVSLRDLFLHLVEASREGGSR